jgi:hypothetical protein
MALAALPVLVVVSFRALTTRLRSVSSGTARIVRMLRFVAWTTQLAWRIVTALAGLRNGNPAADSENEHRGHEDLRNE